MLLKIFVRVAAKFSRSKRDARKKAVLNESLGSPSDARIRRRIIPTVESPAEVRRALCLLL